MKERVRPEKRLKSAGKRPQQIPLWLRRLDQVKAELRGVRFPRTAEEGFWQCAELSAAALRLLREEVRKSHPGASEGQVEREMRRLLARFSAVDARWMARWRKERAHYFGR